MFEEMTREFYFKAWLGVAVIALSFAVLGGAFYRLNADIVERAEAIRVNRQVMNQNVRLVELLAELKQGITSVDAYADRLNMLLPAKDELIDLQKYVENTGRIYNIGLAFAVQPGATVKAEGGRPGSAGFSVDARGGLTQLKRFLEGIETKSDKFLLTFDAMDMNRADGEYRVIARGRAFFK